MKFNLLIQILLISGITVYLSAGTLPAGSQFFNRGQFKTIDAYAKDAPDSAADSVADLAAYLAKGTSSDIEEARAIYIWVTANISYDADAYFSGNIGKYSGDEILASRKGVCSGYATLFKALADAMGLKCEIIHGFAKGYGYRESEAGENVQYKPNHDWNAVLLGGSWYLIDSTWGSGYLNNNAFQRQYSGFYFCPHPERFIYQHYPEDSQWQLIDNPITFEDFLDLPFVYANFFRYGLEIGNQNKVIIKAGNYLDVTLTAPDNVIFLTEIKSHKVKIDDASFVTRDGSNVTVSCRFPSAARYKLTIYAKNKNEKGDYNGVVDYLIDADSGQGDYSGFPTIFGTYGTRNVTIYKPLEKYLKTGEKSDFNVKIPGAVKAAVVVGDKWNFLDQDGDTFSGSVSIDSDKIYLYAMFPGRGDSYDGIAEYSGN